ncbi:hypothetical protein GCM10023185_05860 [Hymenobacter saemangeumensis]|uniref:Leucine-binding protein domain-containing protein n=1 Tax=Hymenobacter saemangeumensis TaxID=1084522 RepID=A0ABP8I197_9BACT
MNHFPTVLATLALSLALAAPATAQAPAKAKPATTPATSPGAQDQRYRSGKAQLDQGNYAAALKELEPLAQPTARFARAADAAYLSAVAAARLMDWPEAEQLLNLLRTEYRAYPNLADALFLQGQVSFEQGDFDTAMKTLFQIPPGTLEAEREAMKAQYLARISDRATWQRLLRRYPNDAVLARAYAEYLVPGGAFTEVDRPQLDELITKFNLDRSRYAPRPRATRKSSYNVGVLLPFELDDTSWQTQRKNQFVTDLYAGLRLAQDSLQRAGRPLQIFAYDTGADTLKLKQVLAQPELVGMDLIIGPVYKSGAKLLARYAREHQIVCVNPLSQDGSLVEDNPWHYLYGPSAATQGRVAAQFAATAFGMGKPGVLLHEDSKDDADFATAYKEAYETLGGKLSAVRRFNPDVDESLSAAFAGLDLGGASHLVVASDSRRAGPYTLGVLAGLGTAPAAPPKTAANPRPVPAPAVARPPLLCPAAWLDNPRIEVEQLNSRNIYFVQPKYFDDQSRGFRRFRQLYLQQQRIPPSVFASQGFELLMFFGSALHQYGPAFQTNLTSAGASSGIIFRGQSYTGPDGDNQIVPITKLENLELQVVR